MTKSKIYNYSKEQLAEIIDNSSSCSEIMKKIGFVSSGSSRKILKRIVLEYELNKNWEEMLKRLASKPKSLPKNNLERENFLYSQLCENSLSSRKDIKKFLIDKKLIPYKCFECENNGIYNGKTLILQLDHINGINNDNRLENLRFLCPNCHSQTETFAGRNSRIKNSTVNERRKEKKEKEYQEKLNLLNKYDKTKFGWIALATKETGLTKRQIQRICDHFNIEYRTKNISHKNSQGE